MPRHYDNDEDVDMQNYSQIPAGPTNDELNEQFPNRPKNTKPTLPFHALYQNLFDPLLANTKKQTGIKMFQRQKKPHELRQEIIERFIRRWRLEVGDDIYPAFRLIMPDKDRDRIVYGLKEKAIAKQLIKVLGIGKTSEDAHGLMNWKESRVGFGKASAGDFPAKCFEALKKRPIRTEAGNMTIEEVNVLLDRLAGNTKEEKQLPIMGEFYQKMNAEEMTWIIKIILKQMKVGATEKTFFNCWHPDADGLFNVSSSLKRVCWELADPDLRLLSSEKEVTLMACFQPQLANFQTRSFDETVKKMHPEDKDKMFWIEEKLDGERMQMHMNENGDFKFYSRKAKDYTSHYGSSVNDPGGTITRHLKNAFAPSVASIILDGEMITWDPVQDAMVAFGTLKSAVNDQKKLNDPTGIRPLYRIFDILYLNGQSLTGYTLRDRRKALVATVRPVDRRFEIHGYKEASTTEDIEQELRKVIAESAEGLVVKNPRSAYFLDARIDDWMKVKPEYMTEHGENIDCLVIGAYWGEGRRGGKLSSFLCGLRADGNDAIDGDHPTYFSFFKVGGGFRAGDYREIQHHTDGKWIKWDRHHPPSDYILLGGGDKQYERPDMWIKPEDSIIISVKAASINSTDQFKTLLTLRFPRFKQLRLDRSWDTAMSTTEFIIWRHNLESQSGEQKLTVDQRRRAVKRTKKEITIAGASKEVAEFKAETTDLFAGQSFFIMSESTKPRKSKAEIEAMVKACGGKTYQSESAVPAIRCVADKKIVKVLGLIKRDFEIVRPQYIFDCIDSNFLLPLEADRHMLHMKPGTMGVMRDTLDKYGDSYARDVTVEDLRRLLDTNLKLESKAKDVKKIVDDFRESMLELDPPPGWMFHRCVVYIDSLENAERNHLVFTEDGTTSIRLTKAANTIDFAEGRVCDDFYDENITHVVVDVDDLSRVKAMRALFSERDVIPRLTSVEWVEESWEEKTLLDAERFPIQ